MKKVNLFLVGIVLGLASISAQTIHVKNRYALFDSGEYKGTNPVLNQTGTLLAFAPAYGQLAVYRFSNGQVTAVGDKGDELFEPVFSSDGDKLMYKNVVYRSRLRYVGVNSFDLNKKEAKQMLPPERDVKALCNYDNGVMLVRGNKMTKATYGKAVADVPPYVWSDGTDLHLYQNGKQKVLNPVDGAAGYIWASLSPDAGKILFTAVNKGTFVCDLQGNIVARLGALNAPVWYDNEFVVGMNDEDDGHVITASEILMKSVDGRVSQRLSLPEQTAMNPTAAGGAGKVAYETQEGGIYVVELVINQKKR